MNYYKKASKNDISFINDEVTTNRFFELVKSFGGIYQYPDSEIIKRDDFIKINEMIGGNNKFSEKTEISFTQKIWMKDKKKFISNNLILKR